MICHYRMAYDNIFNFVTHFLLRDYWTRHGTPISILKGFYIILIFNHYVRSHWKFFKEICPFSQVVILVSKFLYINDFIMKSPIWLPFRHYFQIGWCFWKRAYSGLSKNLLSARYHEMRESLRSISNNEKYSFIFIKKIFFKCRMVTSTYRVILIIYFCSW